MYPRVSTPPAGRRFSGDGVEARDAAAALLPALADRFRPVLADGFLEAAAAHPGGQLALAERWAARPGPARGQHCLDLE
jgi:hypothetical protein